MVILMIWLTIYGDSITEHNNQLSEVTDWVLNKKCSMDKGKDVRLYDITHELVYGLIRRGKLLVVPVITQQLKFRTDY